MVNNPSYKNTVYISQLQERASHAAARHQGTFLIESNELDVHTMVEENVLIPHVARQSIEVVAMTPSKKSLDIDK